ncbi:MAG: sel1 repeat family protein [Sterolibacteriaceae bacterium MAG5]|nr:sel1 repeat family protein [Candidatus Nitricoxidireducens bremensis]
MKTTRNLSLAGLLAIFFLALPATAASNDVDADLRRAAKLQRNGDVAAATAIWKHWAERGNADAAYNLAVIHQHGDGVARDFAEALRWYRHAAHLGDRISEYQIGLMYLNGEGVTTDPEEAHRWLTGHRRHHVPHAHDEQMQAWRRQAAALIEASERREALAKSRANDAQVLAELRRRAAKPLPRVTWLASGG